MKSRTWMFSAAMCLFAALAITVQTSAQQNQFTTFDPPGSVYTQTASISIAGAIAGYYYDQSYQMHGFLRAANGTITSFDVPGTTFIFTYSINPQDAITGFYLDASYTEHGFLRAADGTITTFDPPGSLSQAIHVS